MEVAITALLPAKRYVDVDQTGLSVPETAAVDEILYPVAHAQHKAVAAIGLHIGKAKIVGRTKGEPLHLAADDGGKRHLLVAGIVLGSAETHTSGEEILVVVELRHQVKIDEVGGVGI